LSLGTIISTIVQRKILAARGCDCGHSRWEYIEGMQKIRMTTQKGIGGIIARSMQGYFYVE